MVPPLREPQAISQRSLLPSTVTPPRMSAYPFFSGRRYSRANSACCTGRDIVLDHARERRSGLPRSEAMVAVVEQNDGISSQRHLVLPAEFIACLVITDNLQVFDSGILRRCGAAKLPLHRTLLSVPDQSSLSTCAQPRNEAMMSPPINCNELRCAYSPGNSATQSFPMFITSPRSSTRTPTLHPVDLLNHRISTASVAERPYGRKSRGRLIGDEQTGSAAGDQEVVQVSCETVRTILVTAKSPLSRSTSELPESSTFRVTE